MDRRPFAISPELVLYAAGTALIVLLAWGSFLVFGPFINAITWAAILAILLAPLHQFLRRWVPKPTPRALLTCLLAAVLLVGPVLTVGTMMVAELVRSFENLQQQADLGAFRDIDPTNWRPVVWARQQIESAFPDADLERYLDLGRLDLGATVASAAQTLSQFLLGQSRAALGNLAASLFTLVMTWLTLFYLLRDGEVLLHRAIELLPYPDRHKHGMVEQLNDVIFSSVYGGMAVALVQGVLGGIAFAILGLPSPILWGTVMVVLSFIPVAGSFLVWGPAAVVLLVQGRIAAAVFLILWGGVVIGLVDNLLRPYFISGKTRMHPLLVFMAVLGGIRAFGLLGFFLGPIVVAILTAVLDLYRSVVRGEYGDPVAGPDEQGADEAAAEAGA